MVQLSRGTKDYRKFDTMFRWQCPPEVSSRGGCARSKVSIIPVLELTSLCPLRPYANSPSLRRKRARRAARRQQRLSDLTRRGPPLREASTLGRVVTVDRHDGKRTRLTKNSSRYEHALAHNLRVSFEAPIPHEHLPSSENVLKQLFKKNNSLLDTHNPSV